MDLASKYVNHVIVMDGGKIVLDGKPREVFNSDLAQLIGVGIPKATRLGYMLQKSGIRLNEIPVSSDEATRLLREVLKT